MKKWMKRSLIALVLLAVAVAVIIAKLQPLPVEAVKAERTDVVATATEKGKLISADMVTVYSDVPGKVKSVKAAAGDLIKKGTVLTVIDTADIKSQIAQLSGELKAVRGLEQSSQTRFDDLQTEQQVLALEQAKNNLQLAQDTYQRNQMLFDEGAVTQVELTQAKADLDSKAKAVAQAQTALAQTTYNKTESGKQKQGAALQYQGQKESIQAKINYLKTQLNKCQITAPSAGMILNKKIEPGDYVAPGTGLFTLGTPDRMVIETYFESKDLAAVKKGDKATISFKTAGADEKVTGTIHKIARIAEEKESALGVLEDKVRVEIMPGQKPTGIELIPGITADVELVTQQARNVPALPPDAVFSSGGYDFGWVISGDTAKTTAVTTGIEGDDLVEIKSGLTGGEKVILDPHQTGLKEGIKVTVK